MAVKIIKAPPLQFSNTCTRCLTEFSYELGDLQGSAISKNEYVPCPTCNAHCPHRALLQNVFKAL